MAALPNHREVDEMAIMLALGAAAFYGSADFVGGLALRRNAVLLVALGTQVSGLLVLLVAIPLLGPAAFTTSDLILGSIAGLFGGLGLLIIYRALAMGPMSVVAPISALSAATVPVVAGLILGERPGVSALLGIVVSLGAVVLITREKTEPGIERLSNPRGLLFALVGGAMFGLFFVFQHQTGDSAGLWPLLAARLTSVSLLALLFARRRTPLAVDRRLAGSLLFGGSLDMLANIFFLMATRHGMLAVVAALTGLYPASTVLLAQTRLNERMQRTQMLGLGVAAFAAVLVAA